jgi:hypothetical protein
MRILVRAQRVQEVVKPHRLQRHVSLALGIKIDGDEKIFAVDLQAMAGIEHQRHGVGPAGRDFGGKVGDSLPHVVLREIARRCHGKARRVQQLRHVPGVIGGVGQRRHGAIARLPDHQRHAAFAGGGLREWEREEKKRS